MLSNNYRLYRSIAIKHPTNELTKLTHTVTHSLVPLSTVRRHSCFSIANYSRLSTAIHIITPTRLYITFNLPRDRICTLGLPARPLLLYSVCLGHKVPFNDMPEVAYGGRHLPRVNSCVCNPLVINYNTADIEKHTTRATESGKRGSRPMRFPLAYVTRHPQRAGRLSFLIISAGVGKQLFNSGRPLSPSHFPTNPFHHVSDYRNCCNF